MEAAFWRRKWAAGDIGFHEGAPNAMLIAHLGALGLAPGARVFLPLCGKTRDIPWLLGQGFSVAGAELSDLAVGQLFAELGVEPQVTTQGPMRRFAAPGLVMHQSDVFDLDRAVLGPVDGVYDRAALVALPQTLRGRYAAHLAALTGTAPQLLLAFDYDQAQLAGPPFSVTEAEIRARYEPGHRVTGLERREGRLRGLCVAETAWLLQPALSAR